MKNQLIHEYLNDLINASDIKQSDMAHEMGFEKANIITMFKQGKTRIPLHKIPEFASILQVDAKALMKMGMLEYDPNLFKAVEKCFGTIVTQNEQHILNEIRALSNNSDPSISNISDRRAVEEFVDKLTNKHD